MRGDVEIAILYVDKNSSILNIVIFRSEGAISEALHHIPRCRNGFTLMEEICLTASELSNGQSPGMEAIPIKPYKGAPSFIYA